MLVKTVFPERGASVKNWKNTLRLFVLKFSTCVNTSIFMRLVKFFRRVFTVF
jgi:hypothetical protein